MPPNPTFPPNFQRIFHISKKWIFSGRVFCADSEYMLDVAYKPILAEKFQKTCFLAKFLKSEKTILLRDNLLIMSKQTYVNYSPFEWIRRI
jgi:hypothetical protein